MKRQLSVFFAISLIISIMAGCSGTQQTQVDKSNPVRLKWILGGVGKQADSDKVWERFNQELEKKMPGLSIEFQVIAFMDFAEKWRLLSASGDVIDLCWQGWMMNLADEAAKGAYTPLTNLLQENAPNLMALMPKWVWDGVTINGDIYAVPNYQMMVEQALGIRTPTNLMEKYMDVEEIKAAFFDLESIGSPVMDDRCYDALEKYLKTLQDAGELGLGMNPEMLGWIQYFKRPTITRITETAYVQIEDGKFLAKNYIDISDKFFDKMAEFYQKGYIRRDALTTQDTSKDNGTQGGYIMWVHYYNEMIERPTSLMHELPVSLIPISTKVLMPIAAGTTNSVVPQTSKNPEMAVKFLELINSDVELYNLLVYGFEDVHYKRIEDGRIETLDYVGSPTLNARYGIQKWVVGNTFNAYETFADEPGYNEYIKNTLNLAAEPTPLLGFRFDNSKVKNNIAQCASVETEFKGLRLGAYSDHRETVARYKQKLKDAGVDIIRDELQRQLDEWSANK